MSVDFKRIKAKIGKKAKPLNSVSTKLQTARLRVRLSNKLTGDHLFEVDVQSLNHHKPKSRVFGYNTLTELIASSNVADLSSDSSSDLDDTAHPNSSSVRHPTASEVKSALLKNFDKIAQGMNDEEFTVRLAFEELIRAMLVDYPDSSISSSCIIGPRQVQSLLDYAFACLTGPVLARRLDASKIVSMLIEKFVRNGSASFATIYSILNFNAIKLVPLYADACRGVLGTTSSGLSRAAPGTAARTVSKTTSVTGKGISIMQKLKADEKAASQQKSKTPSKKQKLGQESISKENAVVYDRFKIVARAVRNLVVLDLSETSRDAAVQFVRAVLEFIRHCKERVDVPDEVLIHASQAGELALEQFIALLHDELNFKQVRDSFVEEAATGAGRVLQQVQEASCLACIVCVGGIKSPSLPQNPQLQEWSKESVEFFRESKVDVQLRLVVRLLGMCDDLATRDLILDSFEKRWIEVLQSTTTDADMNTKLFSTFDSLLPGLSMIRRRRWIQHLPRALYGTTNMQTYEQALVLMKRCALMESDAAAAQAEWTEVAKSLSVFWCGFTKSQVVVPGPLCNEMWEVCRDETVGLIAALPLMKLPSILYKAWCASALNDDDLVKLVEVVFWRVRREEYCEDLQNVMSFALTLCCSSRESNTTAVRRCIQREMQHVPRAGELCSMGLLSVVGTMDSPAGWLDLASVCWTKELMHPAEANLKRIWCSSSSVSKKQLCEPTLTALRVHGVDLNRVCLGENAEATACGWIDTLVTWPQLNTEEWSVEKNPGLVNLAKSSSSLSARLRLESNLKLLLH